MCVCVFFFFFFFFFIMGLLEGYIGVYTGSMLRILHTCWGMGFLILMLFLPRVTWGEVKGLGFR